MKNLIHDERAGSMSILVLGASIFVFGLIYIVFSASFNTPIQIFNDMINDDMVTVDTKDTYEMTLGIWKAFPFFVVIGLIIYLFERSKGTMIPAQTYFEYLFMMVIGTVFSIFLVNGYGIAMDAITGALDATTLTNVGETWDASSDRSFYVKIFYYVLMFPAWITSLLYMFFPIMAQRENTFFTKDDDEPDFTEDVEMALGQF